MFTSHVFVAGLWLRSDYVKLYWISYTNNKSGIFVRNLKKNVTKMLGLNSNTYAIMYHISFYTFKVRFPYLFLSKAYTHKIWIAIELNWIELKINFQRNRLSQCHPRKGQNDWVILWIQETNTIAHTAFFICESLKRFISILDRMHLRMFFNSIRDCIVFNSISTLYTH